MNWMTVPGMVTIMALGACQSTKISQAPVPYESTDRISPAGVADFKFRTYSKESGERKEVTGASCKMTGQGFQSQFTSPAEVTVPVFGPKTKPVTVRCTYKDQTKKIALKPYNKTEAKAKKSLTSLKSATNVTGAVIAAAKIGVAMRPRDKSRDEYEYRSGSLTFGGK
ncbi:hypothetical protein [uncultured Roseovarius sp.]|uniref:hypothetical protein n=1 Tax=uncultured Roseovarius sp. TaxID=293344 RepID=UPI0026329F91|nr:hypothetical protein [uncultured Roseovarius sp.]